jgi:hypothetical protein
MDNIESLLHGFTIAVTLPHLALMLIGVLLGILVGVLPGLGAPNGVSLLLPLTFGMQPVSAIILLSSMYWGALFEAPSLRFSSIFRESRRRLLPPSMVIRWHAMAEQPRLWRPHLGPRPSARLSALC